MAKRGGKDGVDTVAERVKTLARTHARHTAAFVERPGESIRRSELPRSGAEAAMARLGATTAGGEPALKMGRLLGTGGMGVVHAAEQTSLGREVAVKALRESFQGEQATAMLLQEAFVMGRVEHPNILPIHDLQYDDAAQPQLVLKRIEGVEWRALMADAAAVAEKFGEDDLLEWNLRVLMQVCNAIHFAHSRDIIHRDLKPENVMIGSFGEVYVTDWGLALSMKEDAEGLLPLVEDATELAGTPQYMAPEMLGGTPPQLGPRTDVYLLGATLYEIVTDLPPHDGKTMEEILEAVVRSEPAFPDDAPPELVAICVRAMDPDPRFRFETALDVRRAIQRFLEHAGSRRLERRASEHAAALTSRLDAIRTGATAPETPTLTELFTQCRFAYQQALEIWPENAQARDGLRDASLAMAVHELDTGNPRVAKQLVDSVLAPDPALVAHIDAALHALAHQQAHLEELERLRRTTDIATGSRDRAIFAAVLGVVWTVAPLYGHFSVRFASELGLRIGPSLFALGTVLVVTAIVVAGRDAIRRSRLSQHLLGGAGVAMVSLPVVDGAGWLLGLDVGTVQSLWPFTWFCISAMLTITVDRRMLPMTVGFLGALLYAVNWPSERFLAMMACNFVMTVNTYLIWVRPPSPDDESLIDNVITRVIRRASAK